MFLPRRRLPRFGQSEIQVYFAVRRQRPPPRDELVRKSARSRELVIGDGPPGLATETGPLRVDLVRCRILIEAAHQKLRRVRLGRQPAARPWSAEIAQITAARDEAIKRLMEAQGGLHRVVGEIVRGKEATIFFGVPLPRHRSVRAFAAQDREAVDPIVNFNPHDDIT